MSGASVDHLAAELLRQLRNYLSPKEWHYASEYPPPIVTGADVDDGGRLLVVTYAGSRRECEWDGTIEDGRAIVQEAAGSLAKDISGDYWRTEGWRGETRSTKDLRAGSRRSPRGGPRRR